MRRISGSDNVFSKLIKDKDEVTYNLLCQICFDENAFIVTDDNSYIIAQNDVKRPMWIFLNKKPEDSKEIASIILERLGENSRFSIIANEKYIRDILNLVSTKTKLKYKVNMKMNAYSCEKVNECKLNGRVVCPSKKYRDIMAKLIIEMERDAEKINVSNKDAYGFADDNVDSKNIFLWEDDGVVAMAKVSHKSDKYARINTVVTDSSKRNKGYGRMLVSKITKELLNEKLIPMLYADASNPISNKMYRRIGYEKQGEVTEFIFE